MRRFGGVRFGLGSSFVAGVLVASVLVASAAHAQTRPSYLDLPATVRVVGAPTAGERVPLLVVLPSSGSDAETIFETLRPSIPLRSFAVLLPQGTPTTGDFLPNFSAYTGWYEARLLEDLRGALESQPIDPERVFLVGFSLGGDLSCALLAHHPELFRGGYVMSTRCGALPSSSARTRLRARDARVAFAIGTSDDAARVTGITKAYERFLASGIVTRLARFDGGHQLPGDRAFSREAFAALFAPSSEATSPR